MTHYQIVGRGFCSTGSGSGTAKFFCFMQNNAAGKLTNALVAPKINEQSESERLTLLG
jgi:hypothetical protein